MTWFAVFWFGIPGLHRLFRGEAGIRCNLIRQRMLFELLSVGFGGLRAGRVLQDCIFNYSFSSEFGFFLDFFCLMVYLSNNNVVTTGKFL